MANSFITHTDILNFAKDKVNLDSDHAKEYKKQVSNLRKKLKEHIQEKPDFGLVKMLNSGSIAKGTALKTINDIDVAVYLNQPIETEDRELLDWLMDRLKEAYPNLEPEQFSCPSGSHCVTLSFKGTGLDVDVVPIIEDENPDDDYGYLMTKDSGDRVLTNITLHIEFIQKRKEVEPDHFKQVIRLVKWWVKQQKNEDDSFRFKSFMVELICAHLLDNGLDFSNYPTVLQKIFTYIVQSKLEQPIVFTDYYNSDDIDENTDAEIKIYDPVNPVNNIASNYSKLEVNKIIIAATEALDAITEARFATTKKRSIDMWKIIFGPSFT